MNKIAQHIFMIAIRIEHVKFALKGMSRFNAKACSFTFGFNFSG